MNDLINTISAAIAEGASNETREAGATACRTILIALEAKEGQPLASPVPVASSSNLGDVATIVAGLKGVPVDQLLDLAISKLRTLVPAEAAAAPVRTLAIPLVPVPRR